MTEPRVSLPMAPVATGRTQLGFTRTACGCPACSLPCRYIPGFLVPEDLVRLAGGAWNSPHSLAAWAIEHLRASPGATVGLQSHDGTLSVVRVPTLVPARQADGLACHWLRADGGCSVHADSPFGCAMCDHHMNAAEGQARSMAGLRAVMEAWGRSDTYAAVWVMLHRAGLVAPSPAESRRAMAAATEPRTEDKAP